MTGGRLAATLAVLASIATILGFLISLGNQSSTTSQPQPSPITTVNSANPVSPVNQVTSSNPVGPTNPTGSAYPASAENNFLNTCEQYTGLPVSHCQCDLSWVEANYSYTSYSASFGAAPQPAVEEAENNATCP
jgi:hypothetical protein